MKRILKFFAGLFLVLAIIAGSLYGIFYYYYGMVDFNPIAHLTNEEKPSQPMNEVSASKEIPSHLYHDENIKNILLIGTDTREGSDKGRSDTVILASVNTQNKKVTLTSFMRDTYITIPGIGKNRLNLAYNYGGVDKLKETLEYNFGIYIDNYITVDFNAFIEGVDALEGIDLEVSSAEIENLNISIEEVNKMNGVDPNINKMNPIADSGLAHLNGAQALGYSRIRYVGNADFERTERQRKVLTKSIEKAKTMNLIGLDNVLRKTLPHITTDVSQGEVFKYLKETPNIEDYAIESFRIPSDQYVKDIRVWGMALLEIDLGGNKDLLYEQIYGFKPSGSNNSESIENEMNEQTENNSSTDFNGNTGNNSREIRE